MSKYGTPVTDAVVKAEETLAHTTGKTLGPAAGNSVATALGGSVGGLVTLGIVAGMSALAEQIEYGHRKRKIVNMYREEVAAKLGMDPRKVDEKAVEELGKGNVHKHAPANGVLASAMDKNRKKRNLGMALAVAAGLTTFTFVGALFGHVELFTPLFAAKVLTSVLSYHAIRQPLRWIGEKLLGIEAKNAHERILEIIHDRDAGKTISRQQIFSVFVAANPELDRLVRDSCGKPFDQLTVTQKRSIAQNVGKLIQIDALTENINQGKVNVSELAFAAEGQVSGVAPKPAEARHVGLFHFAKDKLYDALKRLSRRHEPQARHALVAAEEPSPREYQNEAPPRPFTERFARAPEGVSYTERLERSRAESAALPQR